MESIECVFLFVLEVKYCYLFYKMCILYLFLKVFEKNSYILICIIVKMFELRVKELCFMKDVFFVSDYDLIESLNDILRKVIICRLRK